MLLTMLLQLLLMMVSLLMMMIISNYNIIAHSFKYYVYFIFIII